MITRAARLVIHCRSHYYDLGRWLGEGIASQVAVRTRESVVGGGCVEAESS
jgi:hypothetical protein